MRLLKRQLTTPAGRLDLFCADADGNYVVVELKKTKGADEVVGQTLRYMGWARGEYPEKKIRGIVVVGTKDERLRFALKATPDVIAKEFKLSFE